jgi:hypothetical protein
VLRTLIPKNSDDPKQTEKDHTEKNTSVAKSFENEKNGSSIEADIGKEGLEYSQGKDLIPDSIEGDIGKEGLEYSQGKDLIPDSIEGRYRKRRFGVLPREGSNR